MDDRTTDIRYRVNGMYATESFTGTNIAAVINAIKARYGGAPVEIITMTHRPVPQPPSHSGDSGNRR